MAELLTTFVRKLLNDPAAARAGVKAPVVVWEAPPPASDDEGHWQLTQTGQAGALTRPKPGETLVYPVAKVPGLVNPFPMGITLGRVESNDIVLDDGSVSRFHAWIQFEERTHAWWLTDAESRNGTWVAGTKCEPRKRVALTDGISFKLGDAELRFFLPDSYLAFVKGKL